MVREYSDADFNTVKHLHEKSGFGYILPSLSSEKFYSRRVVGDGNRIGMATFMRLTSEVYLISDPAWRNPAWRMEALRKLSVICNDDAKRQRVQEVVAFLPPPVTKIFGKRLSRLGWSSYQQEEWKCFAREVI